MPKPTIAFIGAGYMASALIDGLLNANYPADHIYVSCPTATHLTAHQKRGVHTATDNRAAASQAEVLVLAVKPKIVATILGELADIIQQQKPLLISVASSVTQSNIQQITPAAVIRAMPNTPAAFGQGITVLCSQTANATHKKLAEDLFATVGHVCWLADEQQMNAVTALSGTGPAYFFLLMEALEAAAIQAGLAPELVHTLTTQTALGAAQMALRSEKAPAKLREQVTSPGGGTAAALAVLETADFKTMLQNAFDAAHERYNNLMK